MLCDGFCRKVLLGGSSKYPYVRARYQPGGVAERRWRWRGGESLDKRRREARRERRGGEGMESEDDGDGPLGEHHGTRGYDHPPDYHSDDAFCEEDGICEDDGFY